MRIEAYGALSDWQSFAARDGERLAAEAAATCRLKDTLPLAGLPGYCIVCDATRQFAGPEGGMRQDMSFRESLTCAECHSISRHRAALAVLQQALPGAEQTRVYITEQATRLFVGLRKRMRRLAGSEFVPEWRKRWRLSSWLWAQGCRDFVRYQDVTALSFRRGSKDAVVSFDVLEHVPDYPQALREFARVLRPGGVLVMTVPFYDASAHSQTIARIREDGSIEHDGEPEYHGDPVSHGVLCFHHLGWDLLESMHAAGFSEAEAVRVSDAAQGVPEPLWLFRARR